MSLVWNFGETCHSLTSPPHLGCVVRRDILSSVFFVKSGNRKWHQRHQTVRRMSAHEGMWRERFSFYNTVNLCGKTQPSVYPSQQNSTDVRWWAWFLLLQNSSYDANFQCHWICLCVGRSVVGGWGRLGACVGTEITVNVTLPPLSIIHFQSIAVPGFVRQLGDDASKMGSIA